MKKISVIIPAYNMERYIKHALLSVINQEGVSIDDMEILAVNDGSKDDTKEIILGFNNEYKNIIRFIDLKANEGVLSATIHALKKVEGENVCLLDADDIWHTNKLSQVLTCLENGYDLVFHEGEFIDDFGNLLNRFIRCQIRDEDIVSNIRTLNGGIPLGSAISFKMSRLNLELLISVYNKFKKKNMDRAVVQDTAILHTLATYKDLKAKCIRKDLYYYRVHGGNTSLNSDFDNVERLKRAFKMGLDSTLFAIEIYKDTGLYYKEKDIDIGFKKFLYSMNFSLKEKPLSDLYKDYLFLLKNNAFTGRKEKITRAIYPLFFRLPVWLRRFLRKFW